MYRPIARLTATIVLASMVLSAAPQPVRADVSPVGKYRHAFDIPGARPPAGELVGASDLSVAPDGTVYVMDEAAGRVQRFSADGQVLDMWGALGQAAGEFAGHSSLAPDGYVVDSRIAVGPTGVVFTSDHGAARIEKFTRSGLY